MGDHPRIRAIISLLSVLLIFPSNADTQPKAPIIDMHLHAFDCNEYGSPLPPNPVTGRPSSACKDRASLDAVLDMLERYHIVKAVASGPLAKVLKWRQEAPDKIIGGVFTSAHISLPELGLLRDQFAAGHVGVLGELGLQYSGLSVADPELEPYLAFAEESNIPVGLHTGLGPPGTPYQCCPKFRVTLGNPLLLEPVLIRHPKLRIYLMHAGYPYLRETIAIMYMYQQVYADVAVINWIIPRQEFHDYLQALIRAGLEKRLMFGSDQMVWPEAIGMAIEGIESASFLSASQKRDIFYNNAVRFLQLDQSERK
jgi:predicted TIM-barrel fold metal-dependent hydrolase